MTLQPLKLDNDSSPQLLHCDTVALHTFPKCFPLTCCWRIRFGSLLPGGWIGFRFSIVVPQHASFSVVRISGTPVWWHYSRRFCVTLCFWSKRPPKLLIGWLLCWWFWLLSWTASSCAWVLPQLSLLRWFSWFQWWQTGNRCSVS